jgi:hypothetical protein
MPDVKIIDDSHHISGKRGNGQLRREVWVDETGKVTRYNLGTFCTTTVKAEVG